MVGLQRSWTAQWNEGGSARVAPTEGPEVSGMQHGVLVRSKTKELTVNSVNNNSPEIPQTLIRRMRERTHHFLESTSVTAIMTGFTIYALYGDDLRVLAFDASADNIFMVFSSISFFLFSLEILLSCWAKPGYFPNHYAGMGLQDLKYPHCLRIFAIGSFYFWLDVVATVSLVTEIPWMLGNPENQAAMESNTGLQSARAGRASRAGARAGRIMRIFRVIRLARLARLYRFVKSGGDTSSEEESSSTEEESNLADLPPESHVGKSMSDLTTRRVILGVLGMLVLIPLLTYTEIDQSSAFGVEMIQNFALGSMVDTSLEVGLSTSINEFLALTADVLMLTVGDEVEYDVRDEYPGLRSEEQLRVYVTDAIPSDGVGGDGEIISFTTEATISVRDELQEAAGLNMIMVTFVILLLAVGTMVFSNDVNRLVLLPIETVVQLVRSISKNPLDFKFKPRENHESLFKEGFETTALLQTITKVAGLMRVGFGEAGASVIARNLQESSDNKLNLLTSGKKIESIFGFCDIRQFTDTTECLQEEVMLFVNRIAHIVHSTVVQCGGCANKNIGDAFLLTWKLDGLSTLDITTLTDRALFSFLKIIAELARNEEYCCSFSVSAMSRLLDRMPNYKVRIGFGLHLGWAIEGAIGSDKKIDASYISPHVTMAEFLESSTKTYGVQLLMSEPFHENLSLEAKEYCRQVDSVQRSEKEPPMKLYTYDCDVNQNFSNQVSQQEVDTKMPAVRSAPASQLPTLAERTISRRATHRRSSSTVVVSTTRASLSGGNPNITQQGVGMNEAAAAAREAVENAELLQKFGEGGGGTATAASSAATIDIEQGVERASLVRPGGNQRNMGRSRLSSICRQPNAGISTDPTDHELRSAIDRRRSLLLMRQGSQMMLRQGSSSVAKMSRDVRLTYTNNPANFSKNPRLSVTGEGKPVNINPLLHQGSMGRSNPLGSNGRSSIIGSDGDHRMTLLARASDLPHHDTPVIEIPIYSRQIWGADQDLKKLRWRINQSFREEWSDAMDSYMSGDWEEALRGFRLLQSSSGSKDSPTSHIVSVIESFNGKAPEDWKGYRKLWA